MASLDMLSMRRLQDVFTPQSYHVVYSCESSVYFGYQAFANKYAKGPAPSNQPPNQTPIHPTTTALSHPHPHTHPTPTPT